MKNFALIGAAGYIAPRHLEAISALGHNLVAAYDPSDSVGILDRYFPGCHYFKDFERFESFLEVQKNRGQNIDYVSICSPNYMHSAHIGFALRLGADAICEKPMVLEERELDELIEIEKATQKKVYTVLQLRLHESILSLKRKVENSSKEKFDIELVYMTSRGQWYHESWKGDPRKSGGLSTNVGIHFFDMLTWIFGASRGIEIEMKAPTVERGFMKLERADVRWCLTIDRSMLPPKAVESKKTTFRSIRIDGEEFEFSEGFTELHKKVYADILDGKGYGIEDARMAIRVVERIRGANS